MGELKEEVGTDTPESSHYLSDLAALDFEPTQLRRRHAEPERSELADYSGRTGRLSTRQ